MKTALVDLHLHLDGSISLAWAYERALARKVIPAEMTFEEYYGRMYREYTNMADAIKKFDYPCDVLQTKEDLHDAAYELVRVLSEEDMVYAEIRFASQQHCKLGLTQYEALEAVARGCEEGERDFGVTARVINCLMHKGDSAQFNDKENRETIEATRKLLGKTVVALDLAGYENNCPFEDYGYLFEIAREYGIPYTIHAAEMGIGSHINDALAMKPNRIGHGVLCVQDDEWLKKVVDCQIPLEVCPTSNCKTRDYASHPIRKLLEAGAYVTVNTDNMMFSRTTVSQEHRMLRSLGVSEETLRECTIRAMKAAFCDEDTKKKCLAEIERRFSR